MSKSSEDTVNTVGIVIVLCVLAIGGFYLLFSGDSSDNSGYNGEPETELPDNDGYLEHVEEQRYQELREQDAYNRGYADGAGY